VCTRAICERHAHSIFYKSPVFISAIHPLKAQQVKPTCWILGKKNVRHHWVHRTSHFASPPISSHPDRPKKPAGHQHQALNKNNKPLFTYNGPAVIQGGLKGRWQKRKPAILVGPVNFFIMPPQQPGQGQGGKKGGEAREKGGRRTFGHDAAVERGMGPVVGVTAAAVAGVGSQLAIHRNFFCEIFLVFGGRGRANPQRSKVDSFCPRPRGLRQCTRVRGPPWPGLGIL